MLKLWIAGLLAVALFLGALFWPEAPKCREVTWYWGPNPVGTLEECK
jgi:hypothetical protein